MHETIKNDPEGRLTESAPYGQHVGLTCVNHPHLRWSTKNIAPIGCRTIFYNGAADGTYSHECNCRLSDLRLV